MNKRDKKREAEIAEQCYVNPSEFDYKKFADLIRADEREACAKMCESHVRYPSRLHFAQAIRARGNT
jgi:hypothetical protein